MFSANIGSSASASKEAGESVDIFSTPADNWRPRRQGAPGPIVTAASGSGVLFGLSDGYIQKFEGLHI